MEQTSDELTYLERLAGELAERGLNAELVRRSARSCLKVANPDSPALNERVFCGAVADSGWCYWWPWRQPIGSVDDLSAVAEKILTVLRSVESVQ